MSVAGTRSVIVADNNEFYRRVLGDFFTEQGFDVRTARDGMQALEMLEQSPPDLLVLDLIMPSIDGAQLCAWVKSRQEHRHIPVIIVSGILCDEIDDLASIGAEAYVAKMPMDQIASALKEAIRLLTNGARADAPILFGFEKMYRREVVLELIQDRRARAETLDSLTEGIVELSRGRRILRTNRAFEAIAGRSACEVLSRPLEEIFPDGVTDIAHMFAATDAETGTTAVFTHRGRHLQAKIQRVMLKESRGETGKLLESAARQNAKVMLHSMLESIGFTLMVEDITDRVQAEKEREALKERLARSEKMSALGVFVSGAAHELNNPLTSILGYSQLVMKKSTKNHSELRKIVEGAQQCKTIVEQLMAFARSLRPDRKVADINAVLRDALEAGREEFGAAGIRVEEGMMTGGAPSLMDAAQIGQVFHHLIDNAIKALGSVRKSKRLRVTTQREGDQIIIEFADNGPGIPRDRLDRIFDPFFTTGDVGTGRGLGLSVSYGIVAAHGGRIAAANAPDGGAVIRVELPASEQQVERAPLPRPQPRADAARRILVVDDEKVVAELIVEILSDPNHQIDSAHNGLDALRLLRHRSYDLIVLDLRMPDMSGQQMYEEMERRHPEHVQRVLFVTGDTVMPEIQEFLRRAGNPCLLKPFSVEDVLRKAREILYSSTGSVRVSRQAGA